MTPEQRERHKERCRAYYKANKERLLAYGYAKRAADPTERKKHDEAYRLRNAEKVRAAKAAYERANPEKVAAAKLRWRTQNPEKLRAAQIRWDKNNPEKKRVHRENRRARERAAVGAMSSNIDAVLMEKQKGRCACCSDALTSTRELDHILPLILGGTNEDCNVQLLCRPCNRSKGKKHPETFMRERGLLL